MRAKKIKYQCPWCKAFVEPVPNDEDGESIFGYTHRPTWLARNPVKCPVCNGVGGPEDFAVIENDKHHCCGKSLKTADDRRQHDNVYHR